MTLDGDYPRMIEVEWYNRFNRRTERKTVKVYSENDEALVRTWHADTNRWSKQANETRQASNRGSAFQRPA